jgi:competence protein CoiA
MLVATRVSDNTHVVASEVAHGPKYRCPDPACNQLVVIRKGSKVIHHFAHRPDASCAYGRNETHAHLLAKLLLRNEFRRRGLQADVERVVLSSESDRRADVLVRKPNTDRRVAIENQHSYLSAPDFERRTKAYIAAGVPVIWIGLLKWTRSLNGDCEPAYRSRGWEDWAH